MFDMFNHESATNSLELMASKLLVAAPKPPETPPEQDRQNRLELLIRMAGLNPCHTESWIERWSEKGYLVSAAQINTMLRAAQKATDSEPSLVFRNMVLNDAQPSVEMTRLFALDTGVGQAGTADPGVVAQATKSQFYELCRMASRNNHRINVWRELLGYIILRNSHRDSELDYVVKVARFTQSKLERTTAKDGKLYKMAAKYVDIDAFIDAFL